MDPITILLIKDLPTDAVDALRQRHPEATIHQVPGVSEATPYLANAHVIAGFLPESLIVQLLERDNQLRWLQSWSAGVNRYPQAELAQEGIYLTTTSGIHADQISEIALASMIMLERRFLDLFRAQQAREWIHVDDVGTVHGKTVTILGAGAIGEELARMCHALDMTVHAVTRSGKASGAFDKIVTLTDLTDVLSESDYVVNILPETPDTHHVMNAETFSTVKPGAYYINVGRGATTDTEALLAALDSGQIRGAALDVFEEEPLPKEHPLWQHDKVFVMPHHAGADVDYDRKALAIFSENLDAFIQQGAPTVNVVDYERGY